MIEDKNDMYKHLKKELVRIEKELSKEDISDSYRKLLISKREDMLIVTNIDDRTLGIIKLNKGNGDKYIYLSRDTLLGEGDICVVKKTCN